MAVNKEMLEMLVGAMATWDKAQADWSAACKGRTSKEAIQAYEAAKEAWLDAQEAVPEQESYATFWEAVRVHEERKQQQRPTEPKLELTQ